MKICIAQLSVLKGDIKANIDKHLSFIQLAIDQQASAIFFPELSITGYEPDLAFELATTQEDNRFDILQKLSNENNIVIGVGMPNKAALKPNISMVIFQPQKPRVTYYKQYLHPGEEQYFSSGNGQVFIEIEDYKIAPAICYESSLDVHQSHAVSNGIDIYLASTLNSKKGVDKEISGLSRAAKKHNVIVMMSNYIGQTGKYDAGGKSSIWDNNGMLSAQLGEEDEALIILDAKKETTITVSL